MLNNPVSFGFANEYRVDISESIILWQRHEKDYVQSECFLNAYRCLNNNIKHFAANKCIYGYVLSTDGTRKVAVRHAWNIINGRKVDVTMFANRENPISVINYVYLPVDEYSPQKLLDKICENNGYVCLPKSEKELKIQKELIAKGIEILE